MVTRCREVPLFLLLLAFRSDPLAAQISVVDSAVNAGRHSSMAIGTDGLPLISYTADSALGPNFPLLKVAHCNDPACALPATITTLDVDDGLTYTSIAVGGDGLGLIVYWGLFIGLRVAHCENGACSSASLATVDGIAFSSPDVAIGADGLALISYFDFFNDDLKVAHCGNPACTSVTVTVLDPSPAGGWYTSVAVGADGRGLIAYTSGDLGGPGGDVALKVAHCDDPSCTSATISSVDSVSQPGEYVGLYPAITIGADGLGLITYQYQKTRSPQELRVAHCSNATCSSASISTLETASQTAAFTSDAVGADGLGLVSYLHQTVGGDLKLARCADPACSAATFSVIDGPDSVGFFSSIAVGNDDLPIISYFDETNSDLKVAHCLDRACGAPPPGPLGFYVLLPCRVVDTRNPDGPLAGPALVARADRLFRVASACGIPPTAKALSVNLAVTGPTAPGNLRVHPIGTAPPLISSINYVAGQTSSNNAVVGLSALAELAVYCAQASGAVHFILDVNGYFE